MIESVDVVPDDWHAWADVAGEVFRWPEAVSPAEWAQQNRVLGDKESAEPGQWDLQRAAYQTEVMNAAALPFVRVIDVQAPPQVGKSEIFRNALGYLVDKDPGPALMVMATEDTVKTVMDKRLGPLFKNTPALAKYLQKSPRKINKNEIDLKHMLILNGWAGSPASLGSHPARYVFLDEVDKYPPSVGEEADPLALAEARTRTYRGRFKIFRYSTPTTQLGNIARCMAECSLVFRFWVPCPACGKHQVPNWPGVRGWEDRKDGETRKDFADRIKAEHLAYYQCEHCSARWTDSEKQGAVRLGVWWPDGYGAADGSVKTLAEGFDRGVWPKVEHIGFYISGILSPWIGLDAIAAAGLLALGDPAAQKAFRNNVMGDIFEEQIQEVKVSVLDAKMKGAPPALVVPAWAQILTATADTQKDHFVYVIRAWGFGYRSQLVHHGRAETFAELTAATVDAPYYFARDPDKPEMYLQPWPLLIDAGGTLGEDGSSRTDQVYRFSLGDPGRILAVRGHGGKAEAQAPVTVKAIAYCPPSANGEQSDEYTVKVRFLNTTHYKDLLAARIQRPVEAEDYWDLNDGADREYRSQLGSEHKVKHPKRPEYIWKKKSAGAANHFWDAEYMQGAAADIAGVWRLRKPGEDAPDSEPEFFGGRRGRDGGPFVSQQ